MPLRTLTESDIDHFIRKGYVKLEGAFPREVAEEWSRDCFHRLGYAMDDPTTWAEPRIHMGGSKEVDVKGFAPRVYDAVLDLLGGEDRVHLPIKWSDHFIVNLGLGADDVWKPAGPDTTGWHKDGDFFLHFLDSPEQGLLVFVNWTDVVHHGGPTYIATDSVPVVARYLADHPEGVQPGAFGALVKECREFEEATAQAGDVYLLHPFLLHAASQNPLRRIRIITNPPVHLRAPMRFDRENSADHSPIERAVLAALGVESYAFRLAAERQRIVPERERRQQQMMEAERARLAGQTG